MNLSSPCECLSTRHWPVINAVSDFCRWPLEPTGPLRAVIGSAPAILWLALGVAEAEDLYMTPNLARPKPTEGALRAARAIQQDASLLKSLPDIIDRETGVREVLEILEAIIAQAGDLVESRSPELVAEARATLRKYNDDAARQAE